MLFQLEKKKKKSHLNHKPVSSIIGTKSDPFSDISIMFCAVLVLVETHNKYLLKKDRKEGGSFTSKDQSTSISQLVSLKCFSRTVTSIL